MALSPGDPNSYARPDLACVCHIHLQLTVDFDRKILFGKAILDVEKKGTTDHVLLDVRGLHVQKVFNHLNGSALSFNVGDSVLFGSKLSIELPMNDETKYKIEILYETSSHSTALQWLTPEQTAGGQYPYMFSQCQAIHARSMLPCQDTPSVKCTYSAKIHVSKELTVLMSAILDSVSDGNESTRVYEFYQPIPIPSYLIAIAVGALIGKRIGPRSKVWAEKELIDRCAYEFAETESMLAIAEDICGPYIWGIYDLLVLPPSFPFGGMENPCLTFVTPTLLAGDRSLATVVAHEIAHSWTGNLVTNANFEHFWLNEGFTMFIERKINARMFGENVRHFQALNGLKSLMDNIKTLGELNQLTNLVPNLTGVDPDDSFSIVPYEKGHTFLFYLEQLLGGSEMFDPFLKSYLNEYKYKSIVTSDWKNYLYTYFAEKREVLDKVDWDTWLHKPGMPPLIPNYDTTLINACAALAEKWITWNQSDPSTFGLPDIENFTPTQKLAFLTELFIAPVILPLTKIETIQDTYDFDSVMNSEIRFMWLRLCIKSRRLAKVSDALTFATEQGRMKFVRPIFQDLYQWEEVRPRAIQTFLEKRDKMMYVTAHMVAKVLHLDV